MAKTYDYVTAEAEMGDAKAEIVAAVNDMRRAKTLIVNAQNRLAALPTSTQAVRTWIGEQATANPEDAELQHLKGDTDKVVADFVARKTTADAMTLALGDHNP